MPVPSQGHYGFHSFPVVDWSCLFIWLSLSKIVRSSVILLFPSHLPWYIAPNSACWTCKIQFAQERLFQLHNINFHDNKEDPHKFSADEHGDTWVKLMNGLLLKIANQLGITTLSYIIKDPDFINCRGSIHHWTDILLIKMFNEKNRYPSIDISHTVYGISNCNLTSSSFHTNDGRPEYLVSFRYISKWKWESTSLIILFFWLTGF
jgi:hypothetical protein